VDDLESTPFLHQCGGSESVFEMMKPRGQRDCNHIPPQVAFQMFRQIRGKGVYVELRMPLCAVAKGRRKALRVIELPSKYTRRMGFLKARDKIDYTS